MSSDTNTRKEPPVSEHENGPLKDQVGVTIPGVRWGDFLPPQHIPATGTANVNSASADVNLSS